MKKCIALFAWAAILTACSSDLLQEAPAPEADENTTRAAGTVPVTLQWEIRNLAGGERCLNFNIDKIVFVGGGDDARIVANPQSGFYINDGGTVAYDHAIGGTTFVDRRVNFTRPFNSVEIHWDSFYEIDYWEEVGFEIRTEIWWDNMLLGDSEFSTGGAPIDGGRVSTIWAPHSAQAGKYTIKIYAEAVSEARAVIGDITYVNSSFNANNTLDWGIAYIDFIGDNTWSEPIFVVDSGRGYSFNPTGRLTAGYGARTTNTYLYDAFGRFDPGNLKGVNVVFDRLSVSRGSSFLISVAVWGEGTRLPLAQGSSRVPASTSEPSVYVDLSSYGYELQNQYRVDITITSY